MRGHRREGRVAALEHLTPVGLGALVGSAAIALMPSGTENRDFFGVAAQVVPVILLALAIEARLFGVRGRRDAQDRLQRGIETSRVVLSYATVGVLLIAEVHALGELAAANEGSRMVWIEQAALAWGFTTVAVLAVMGLGRPRLVPTLTWFQPFDSTDQVIVHAGASNEYGDTDVSPVMNLLIPHGLSIHYCDAEGNVNTSPAVETLRLAWEHAGVSQWDYAYGRVLATAGDAGIKHFSLGGLIPGRRYPVILRFDHAELSRGRVEIEKSVCTGSDSQSSNAARA